MEQDLRKELEIQRNIAYTSGILQGDVTIKTLISSLAEGVVIINEIGRIVLINNRLSEMTGYSKEEVMGLRLDIFLPDHVMNNHNSHLKSYFNEPHIRPMGIGMELSARKKDQTTFPVEISLSSIETETGRLAIGFITDISKRKEIDDELKRRNVELDAYAHTVAHDLNSSLVGIVGISELLLEEEVKLTETQKKELLQEVVKSGMQMKNVIRELLLFATMKKEDVELSEVDIKQIIDNTCHRLKYQIKNNNAQIIIDDNIPNCISYAPWVEEIWFNFLSNAIKYNNQPIVIKIEGKLSKNGLIKYSVVDNGIGIREEELPFIFLEKEFVSKNISKGFGLGMPIVKKIIDKLNGKLQVESKLGVGSTFSFFLPKFK